MDLRTRMRSRLSALYAGVFVWVVVCLFAILAFRIVYRAFVSSSAFYRWRYPVERLEEAVVQDLCREFDLPESNSICGLESDVYSADFLPIVRASFEEGSTTYDEVQDKIEQYQYECAPLEMRSDGEEQFDCWYAFSKSRMISIKLSFSNDDVLQSIRFESFSD